MTTLSVRKKPKFLRAGIVGCGRIASSFDKDPKRVYVATHAGAYTRLPGIRLIAACDLDEKRLQEFGATWKVQNLYSDFDQMLADNELDILSICTWPQTHYDLVCKAVRAGIKTIFCEKPLTDDLRTADQLVSLCERNKVVLAVNHSRRWDTGHQKIKKLLDGGKIGKIHHVQCYYTAGISNTGTHLFDLLRFFLGEARWVDASPAPVFGDRDPTLSGQIFFEKDVLVTLSGLDVKDYLIFELDFYGSKGRLRIQHSGFKVACWSIAPSPFFSGYQELTPSKPPFSLIEKNMMMNAVSDIIRCVKTGKQPCCSGFDGLKALELICAFKLSFENNERVHLPLKNREVTI